MPFDEDMRGVVVFLTIKGDCVTWDMQRFEYDVQAAMDHMQTVQPPFYRNLYSTLKFASIRNDLIE